MLRYGKSTQTALAALRALAEVYTPHEPDSETLDQRWLSAVVLAGAEELPQPFVAKLLTILSQAGLVEGAPGPGGGYRLARDPSQISLDEVAGLFEINRRLPECPLGIGPCDEEWSCSLHEEYTALRQSIESYFSQTSLVHLMRPSCPHRPDSSDAPEK